MLERGSRWHVGDGAHVRIWKDRWLPTPKSFKVTSLPRMGLENAPVSMLIDYNMKQLCFEVLMDLFVASEMATELRLPLDLLLLYYKKHGDLTVGSAYEVARTYLLNIDGNGLSAAVFVEVPTQAWQRLWFAGATESPHFCLAGLA